MHLFDFALEIIKSSISGALMDRSTWKCLFLLNFVEFENIYMWWKLVVVGIAIHAFSCVLFSFVLNTFFYVGLLICLVLSPYGHRCQLGHCLM